MANRRPNDEIDKMAIWSKANTHEYDKGYEKVRDFKMTKMEKKLKETDNAARIN